MTLGALALAIGILVDEGVVEIENIDNELQNQPSPPIARGVLNATQKTVLPRFLVLLSIVAMFVTSLPRPVDSVLGPEKYSYTVTNIRRNICRIPIS
jgi:AcrB/AcrD/AcrF family